VDLRAHPLLVKGGCWFGQTHDKTYTRRGKNVDRMVLVLVSMTQLGQAAPRHFDVIGTYLSAAVCMDWMGAKPLDTHNPVSAMACVSPVVASRHALHS
jgi:hypothetical protein